MITWTNMKDGHPPANKPVLLARFHGFPERLKVSSGRWDGKKFTLDHPSYFDEDDFEFWTLLNEPEQELKIVKRTQYFEHESDGTV